MTYIPVRRRFLFLVSLKNWTTRKMLAWCLSNALDARFGAEALKEAIAEYCKPEIMNTDQGSQSTGSAWITPLTDAKIKISMPLGVGLQTPDGNRWAGGHLPRTALAIPPTGGSLAARIAGQNKSLRVIDNRIGFYNAA